MWKAILFMVPLSGLFVPTNTKTLRLENQTELQNEIQLDAWEIVLAFLDDCVDFTNVGTEPEDIHFFIDGYEL